MTGAKAFVNSEFVGVTFVCDCERDQRVQAPIDAFSLHTGPCYICHPCTCTKEYGITLWSNIAQIDGVAYEYDVDPDSILATVTEPV